MKRIFYFITLLSCSDPVPDGQLAALPPENPSITAATYQYHRAGQPCVLCHDPSGPASDAQFAVAGTIFAQPDSAIGVDQATVALTDSAGSAFTVQTNCVGNFFVPRPGFGNGAPTWDPQFPIFVRVFKGGLARTMQGQIGRERSCANCHNDPDPTSPQVFSSVGHLFLYGNGDTPPPYTNNCPVSPVVQ